MRPPEPDAPTAVPLPAAECRHRTPVSNPRPGQEHLARRHVRPFELGDAVIEREQEAGAGRPPKAVIRELAEELGFAAATVRVARWVAGRIPPGDPLRNLEGLNYALLRRLAGIEDPQRRIALAKRAAEEKWSVRRLEEELGQSSCAQCRGAISEGALSVDLGKDLSRSFCGDRCAAAFFSARAVAGGRRQG
jgi:hypothetical protein